MRTRYNNYYKTKKRCVLLTFFCTFSLISIGFMRSFKMTIDQDGSIKLTLATDPGPQVTCDWSQFRYDHCKINGPTILDPTSFTLYSIGPSGPINSTEKVKPYPRKWERFIMDRIKEVTIKTGPIGPIGPKCEVHHNSPAIVFSVGGYTGNFFHDIGDGFLPLFITLNYLSLVDRDVILVVDKAQDWWLHKYADVINSFTKHSIINLENETSTHCFTWGSVGLISHGFMDLDPKALPSPLTLTHFYSFFRNAYDQGVGQLQLLQLLHNHHKNKPRLVWLGRTGSIGRAIVNQDEARLVVEEVGFNVFEYEPSNNQSLREAYTLLNMSHAMIGVHGAALTHLFLLRPGSVMVQVMPLGLEWAGEECYGRPAKDVGLEYMMYKVSLNESTLSSKYKMDDPILKNSDSNEWGEKVIDIYLKEQDVKLDLGRFRSYMEKVYEKAKGFMDIHG